MKKYELLKIKKLDNDAYNKINTYKSHILVDVTISILLLIFSSSHILLTFKNIYKDSSFANANAISAIFSMILSGIEIKSAIKTKNKLDNFVDKKVKELKIK